MNVILKQLTDRVQMLEKIITSSVVLSLVSSLVFSDVMGMVGGIFSPLD